MSRLWQKGDRVRVWPSQVAAGPRAPRRVQPDAKLGTVRRHHTSSVPKADLVSVNFDDGSPADVVSPDRLEVAQ